MGWQAKTTTPNINSILGAETAKNTSAVGGRSGEALQVAGEMDGQQQEEHSLTALVDDLDSVPSKQDAQLKHFQLQFQRI